MSFLPTRTHGTQLTLVPLSRAGGAWDAAHCSAESHLTREDELLARRALLPRQVQQTAAAVSQRQPPGEGKEVLTCAAAASFREHSDGPEHQGEQRSRDVHGWLLAGGGR